MFDPGHKSSLPILLVVASCLPVALTNSGCSLRAVVEPEVQTVSADDSTGKEQLAEHFDQSSPTRGTSLVNPDVWHEEPNTTYCRSVSDWDAGWKALEWKVLELVNRRRAEGADCGRAGSFEPAQPLAMNSSLRCVARRHAVDMGSRGRFDHFSAEGVGPSDRLTDAGYSGSLWGENIAWGYATPEQAVAGWLASANHCATLMDPRFTEIGIGYHALNLWTQLFGRE